MEQLKFIQIQNGNAQHLDAVSPLYLAFCREINEHQSRTETQDEMMKDLLRRIHIQGSRDDMHFELCYYKGVPVGFANFAIDLGTIYGLIDPGYGTVMDFYIAPEFRRRGFGRALFGHVESVLQSQGARFMYICPDPVTGEPFWTAMGFQNSGKVDPDDKLPLYIKKLWSTDGTQPDR